MKKFISLFLTAAMLISFAACSNQTQQNSSNSQGQESQSQETQNQEVPAENVQVFNEIKVTDMTGREIVLKQAVSKIVVLSPSDCEILYALGVGDLVVGRGTYCDYPPQVAEIAAVESGSGANTEQIIALQPDVVFMNTMSHTKEQVAALENAGVTVVCTNADNINDTYKNIEVVASVVGKDKEAQTIINDMKASLEKIKADAKGDGSQTIYFEVSPLQYGLWAAGSNTFMDEAAQMLGLKNAFDDVQGWGEISEEQVIERNPDYIVSVAMYFGEGPTPEEEILSRQGWENVSAVKNNKIFNLKDNELSRPTPRIVEGVQKLFDFIYK